jgi:hypothetical protein
MASTGQALIVIHRPKYDLFGGGRSFIVRIDGRRIGRVAPGASGEFPVEPGEHQVAVSMDWFRSQPVKVAVGPGSRTELMIGGRSLMLKAVLPAVAAALVAPPIMDGLRAILPPVDAYWWLRWLLFIVLYVVLYGGYVLVTSLLWPNFAAVWTLEPVGTEAAIPQP